MRILTMVLLTLVSVCLIADRELMNVLSVQIMADLHLSRALFGALSGVTFGLLYTLCGIPLAMLADRFSRKWILAVSLGVWSVMTALCGRASSFAQLALVRWGVAVGEAGGIPPSQSMISDLYPHTHRARAFSIWGLGGSLGIITATAVGGHIGAEWGWRTAFLVFGIPGLLLSLVIAVFMAEPQRGRSDAKHGIVKDAVPLLAVLRFMMSQQSLVHTVIGFALINAVITANATWVPAFLQNSYGFSLRQVAAILGLILGSGSLVGALLGGYLVDRLARAGTTWRLRFASVALLIATPFGFAVYLVNDRALAVGLLFIPITATIACIGPTHAAIQSLVGARMRATASALTLLIGSILGGALGPFIVGSLADSLEPYVGQHAVRYALLGSSVFTVWSALHFWKGSRTLLPDLERATFPQQRLLY